MKPRSCSHFGLVPYQVVCDKLGLTAKSTARRYVAEVVVKFIRAYRPELTPNEAWQLALREDVQADVKRLVELALLLGAKWPDRADSAHTSPHDNVPMTD